jgi:hypothetical protein
MLSKTHECRAAISAGDYGSADRLLVELRAQVEEAWPAASADERQSIAAQVLELLTWARHTVLVRRSHTQRRLNQLIRCGAYAGPSLGNGRVNYDG